MEFTKEERAEAAKRCKRDVERALWFLRDRGWITNGRGKGTRVKFERKIGTLALSTSGELMFNYRIREVNGKYQTYGIPVAPLYWSTIKAVE